MRAYSTHRTVRSRLTTGNNRQLHKHNKRKITAYSSESDAITRMEYTVTVQYSYSALNSHSELVAAHLRRQFKQFLRTLQRIARFVKNKFGLQIADAVTLRGAIAAAESLA